MSPRVKFKIAYLLTGIVLQFGRILQLEIERKLIILETYFLEDLCDNMS